MFALSKKLLFSVMALALMAAGLVGPQMVKASDDDDKFEFRRRVEVERDFDGDRFFFNRHGFNHPGAFGAHGFGFNHPGFHGAGFGHGFNGFGHGFNTNDFRDFDDDDDFEQRFRFERKD